MEPRSQALEHLLQHFSESFSSAKCDVCGESKWERSFFCRACCIKLQRAHLMSFLQKLVGSYLKDLTGHELRRVMLHWDLCRDYLVQKQREHRAA
jgi:hypothetical protein